jgi:hypothetical protein
LPVNSWDRSLSAPPSLFSLAEGSVESSCITSRAGRPPHWSH